MPGGVSYKDAGVDIDAGTRFVKLIASHMRRTFNGRVISLEGGFGGLFSLDYNSRLFRKNYKRPVLVACTDGVGTKLKIAFMTHRYRSVGIDLVAMSVNDLVCQGAEPLFFLDYFATSKMEPEVAAEVVGGIADGCIQANCALVGGENAELPGFYQPGEFDVAGFAVGVVDRSKIIRGRTTQPKDKILGLASNGLHSNGFSLVRKVFFEKANMSPEAMVEELGHSLADELLRPTRIYVRAIMGLLSQYKVKKVIRGIAHITGGGLYENIPRILPADCAARIRKGTWPVHPIFPLIQKLGSVAEEEMYRVFNTGIGMVLIVAPYYAAAVMRKLRRLGEAPFLIGEVTKGNREVVIE